MNIQLIIAGDVRQAAYIANAKRIKDYRYIQGAHDLISRQRGQTVWLFGTYYRRRDWRELQEILRYREHTTVEVER